MFSQRGEPLGGNSSVPWKRSRLPSRAAWPHLSWVMPSGVRAPQGRAAPDGHGRGEHGAEPSPKPVPVRVGSLGRPPRALRLHPAHEGPGVQAQGASGVLWLGEKLNWGGNSGAWGGNSGVWGDMQGMREKRLERGLKSSSPRKSEGREEALC